MPPADGERRKVLFLTQRFLYPLNSGGQIRSAKLLENLRDLADVTLVSNVEVGKDDPYLEEMRKLCAEFVAVPYRRIRRGSLEFFLRAVSGLFSKYPIAVVNDHSRALEAKVLELVRERRHDLVICDFLQPALNVRHVDGCATLLFQHNVESTIFRRHFETTSNPLMRSLWRLQWKRMETFEKAACRSFTGVVAVSDVDRRVFAEDFGARRARAIPTGVDLDYFRPVDAPGSGDGLIFTGSMDWLPNEDAVLFFAREVLGRVREKIPGARLTVVGRSPSHRLRRALGARPGVEIVGRVDDVRPYLARHAVSIVPLKVGGGTRMKIYEAMAMGTPVVSTRVGAEGLPLEDGKQILLADSAEAFGDAVVRLLGRPDERRRIAVAGLEYVRANCGWKNVARTFAEICEETIQAYRGSGSSA